jgi:TetR/AcrR family transcriptional regulator, transcriptional repressor for nem operon
MGRRKNYDRDEIVVKAMRLFWERGYHATSTRDLTDAMGVNPYSLYAEFGSKEALFDHAVVHYMETVVTRHFGRLEAENSGIADVVAVLDWFGDNGSREGSELGCLMGNTSTERAPNISSSRAHTERFVSRVQGAFAHALTQAAVDGDLVSDAPVDGLSAGFATHLMGVFALSRAQVDPAVIRQATDQQLRTLGAFRP